MVGVLAPFVDEYGIALVNTQGRFTEYTKKLIDEIHRIGANVATLLDYDAAGIAISNSPNTETPRLGIDRHDTIKYFQEHGYPDFTAADVEERYKPKGIESIRDFVDPEDYEYLKSKRIELNAINTKFGAEQLWQYILYRLKQEFPTRNYNRAISSSPDLSGHYPEAIRNFTSYITSHVASLVAEEIQTIESELAEVHGFINVNDKRDEIDKRLGKIVGNDPHLKEIASQLEEMSKKEGYDSAATVTTTTNDDAGSTSG